MSKDEDIVFQAKTESIFKVIVVGDPAVDGDQQTATFRRTTLYNIRGQSVVILSNRYLPARPGSQLLEHFPQQDRGGDAIHIPIPEDLDQLGVGNRPVNPVQGFAHILEQEGIVQQ